MERLNRIVCFTVLIVLAGVAGAAEVLVTDDIATSETWTADNVYNLQDQIYVLPGATLTIEPGTLLKSTAGLGGSLAVCRGAQIYVNGTAEAPVIMTSTNDDMVTWREVCNEWGNLTIMGDAIISASHYGGVQRGNNTKIPTGLNEAQMEGLVAAYPGDPNVMYGGDNDDDDSGSISYLSLRYGGKVIELANELNGLSLGGIGRGTDIQYVEVMNNIDDGIELWGGTVNIKYFAVWNIGDDSFDIDQGWRGKAQFGLIVQGHSNDGYQGGGIGDNAFEMDGAEDSDAQPVTTAVFYNMTVIGQPVDGDGATAWRDNARAQFRNCIFMDIGEKVVRFDGDDGDGAQGYGYNGTPSWEDHWTTPYSYAFSTSQPNLGGVDPATLYGPQVDGMLCEISDSVFYANADYDEAIARGVFDPANNNVYEPADMPIKEIVRAPAITRGGKIMVPVTYLDPRAANDALTSVNAAPDDGFFTPAYYRGAFDGETNWLEGWTAAHAYGMTGQLGDPGIPGDLNGDGSVDLDDFVILKNAFGINADGDLNGDGVTDLDDFVILKNNFGRTN